jgi:hypothetical protein
MGVNGKRCKVYGIRYTKNLTLIQGQDWKAKGYKHYMDWLFKEWLDCSKPTEKETEILRFLQRIGFVEVQKA